jgi:nucleotide-binding universal stress UspA family protein
MKALVAIDGSACSRNAIDNVCRRQWPADSQMELLTVLHGTVPFLPDPTFMLVAARAHSVQLQANAAPYFLKEAVQQIEASCPGVRVTTKTAEGRPTKAIVDEARNWGADLVILGSHGRGPLRRLLLGSVSRAVRRSAPCPVQVVRPRLRVR